MNYHSIVSKVIEYIEAHLHEDLTLETVADYAGFSKYHFHRFFRSEIGVSMVDYVRERRIANSASMLLYTDVKILDIALYFRFESQESFTRAFKKVYHLPPGQYRKWMSKITLQREENTMKNDSIKGWFLSGSHPFHYEMGVDNKIFHQGHRSGYIKSITVQSNNEFGTMMQQIKSDKYINKRVKLSGFLKSKGIDGFCGFWMRVDDAYGDVLQFDNMGDRPITKETDWNHYYIVLDVPSNSSSISFGVLLSGNGQVWIDQLKFEMVDKKVPTTNIDYTKDINEEPMNLSFEVE